MAAKEWAVGVTLGFEGREHTAIASPLSRQTRVATPALGLGVSRRLGALEVGLHGRIRRQVETVELNAVAAEGQVYELAGYREVPGLGMSINGNYFRRREENAPSAGVALAGRFGRADWTVVVEQTSVRERLWIQRRNDPPRDQWNARTWSGRFAAQRPFGPRAVVTLHAKGVFLTGDAALAGDSGAIFFSADERALEGEAELRLLPGGRPGWSGAFTLALGSQRRERADTIPGLRAEVTASSFTSALEMGRFLGPRFFVSVGGVVSWYGPTGSIPNPTNHGAVYRANFATELELYSKAARPTAVIALIRWSAPGRMQVWMTARTERLVPTSAERLTAFTPSGSRVASSLVAGVTLGNP